jgi:hypothetical protein
LSHFGEKSVADLLVKSASERGQDAILSHTQANNRRVMENELLQRGIAAIRAGDKAEARRLLGRAIRQNPRDERAWLWMSGAVDTARDRAACLNKVLEIDPRNETAQHGLTALQRESPTAPTIPIETQPVPQPKPTLVQAVLGTEPPMAEQVPSPDPAHAAAAYPYVKVTDMLDHSKPLDELDPEKREALEGFVPLIAQDLTVNHLKPETIIDRISTRGFSRTAVEQVVREVARQPIRAPVRYQRKLTQEQLESLPSPWFTMWTNPRETIRRIVYYDPKQDVLLLAALQGFVAYLSAMLYAFLFLALISNDYAQAPGTWESDLSGLSFTSFTALTVAFGMCAVIGPIAGLIGLYLYGWLFRVTGRWLGGQAYPIEVRAALAWSAVPQIWGAIFQLLKLLLIAYVLYANATDTYVSGSALLTTLGIFFLFEFAIGIWTIIVYLKSLGEVHGFSAWRALGTALLGIGMASVASMIVLCIFNAIANALMAALLGASGY